MTDRERRVFADHYKRYDGKHICVVTTAKNYESQEDTVSLLRYLFRQERICNNFLERF